MCLSLFRTHTHTFVCVQRTIIFKCGRLHSCASREIVYTCVEERRALKHFPSQDDDPYVRKTACMCVAKLYDISPDLVRDQGFIETLR